MSVHHGGGVGIGNSIHAGMVVVADGTDDAAERLERVLTADPGTGVMRHADAGYPEAVEHAREHGLDLPSMESVDSRGCRRSAPRADRARPRPVGRRLVRRQRSGRAVVAERRTSGRRLRYEGKPEFPEYGMNIHVLWPGQPNGLYHRESVQEDFLVVSGECLVLIEGAGAAR